MFRVSLLHPILINRTQILLDVESTTFRLRKSLREFATCIKDIKKWGYGIAQR